MSVKIKVDLDFKQINEQLRIFSDKVNNMPYINNSTLMIALNASAIDSLNEKDLDKDNIKLEKYNDQYEQQLGDPITICKNKGDDSHS